MGSKYGNSPEDWHVKCTNCNCDNTFSSRASYANVIRKLEKTGKAICVDCRHKAKVGKPLSSDAKQKMSQSATKRWNETAEDEDIERRRKISEHQVNRYQIMTDEERNELNDKIKEGQEAVTPKQKELWLKRKSISAKRRMKELGIEYKFQPGFNVNAIPFIETKLTNKYNTEFQHALSPKGEFWIHDKENKRRYYADAYSHELNLWIEIDEKHHFINGNIREKDIMREKRIKELLGCTIKRVKYQEIKEVN